MVSSFTLIEWEKNLSACARFAFLQAFAIGAHEVNLVVLCQSPGETLPIKSFAVDLKVDALHDP